MFITKMLASALVSSAKSIISSEIKTEVKKLISNTRKPSIDKIHEQIQKELGFITSHYNLDKNNKIVYKSSPVFFLEYLTNSPTYKNRIIKDEETGKLLVDGTEMSGVTQAQILESYSKDTKISSPSINSHFTNACKLLPVSDITSIKLQSYLDSVNKTSVLDNFFNECFSIDDKFSSLLFKKWLVGTVGRIINPGISHDGCLILKGSGGIGKTRFFRELLPKDFSHREVEIFCDIKNSQKFLENIIGKSIACFDELSVLDYEKSEEIFKQLLSSNSITVRLPWKREPQTYKMRQGFCGTTNKEKFIKDPFLSRRLWICDIGHSKLNIEYLINNISSAWKEAHCLYLQGYDYHLSELELIELNSKNSSFIVGTP